MLKSCIFIKNEFIQRYFSRIFAFFRGSLNFFGDWVNVYLMKHLLMSALVDWYISVITALFSNGQNTLEQLTVCKC